MKKILIGAAISCLLLAGCTANNPTSTPGTSGTQAAPVPTTTVPSTTAPEATTPTATLPPETTMPETSAPQGPVSYKIYTPNETLDGFNETNATINSLNAEGIMITLIAAGAVGNGVSVNSAVPGGTQLNLDLNDAFLAQLQSMGATGEKMLLGSVVNTFLSAYQCETVMLTVNGEIMDSGHAIYDFPLGFFE